MFGGPTVADLATVTAEIRAKSQQLAHAEANGDYLLAADLVADIDVLIDLQTLLIAERDDCAR